MPPHDPDANGGHVPVLIEELESDPPRGRLIDLSTIRDVRRSYATCLRLALAGRMSTADLTRYGYAHKVLCDLISSETIDKLAADVDELKRRARKPS